MIVIDLYLLGELMLMPFMRKPVILTLWSTISGVLNDLHDNIHDLFNRIEYDLTFNGQVIYLEHYLNDVFDPVFRRIYIEDTDEGNITYLFNAIENNEITYLSNEAEGAPPVYFTNLSESIAVLDFQVYVPSDIVFDELIFRKHVDKYRLAGKNYEIIVFPWP